MGLMGWWSAGGTQDFLEAGEELEAMRAATEKAAWVMNDEVERAETALSNPTNPFDKLAYGAALFWQAVLGFDKEMMGRAKVALADAETASADHQKRAVKDPSTAHHSKIYPAGSEYSLCQAQAQLLGAILGILAENWTEGLFGVNKLRKAYFTLQALVDIQKKYLSIHKDDSSRAPSINGSVRSGRSVGAVIDLGTVTSDPMDLYVYSGISMCWGIINIVLSVVPPVFRHLLAMFNYRGDRDYGLELLWSATNYKHNIFGAIGGLATLLYHNIAIGLTDIRLKNAWPEDRLRVLLRELRELYPDSQLWRMEESRLHIINRELEPAVALLSPEPTKPFEQLSGLRLFEKALDLMFLHRFEDCAQTWLECIKLNNWSHGMYFYAVASCHIELYRDLKASDPAKARVHADKAKEYLDPVPVLVKQKALMGKPLPFDAFIGTKLEKWEARSKARKCDLIDAVGVSPIEELIHFWTGYRRMNPQQLRDSLARLAMCESSPEWKDETIDEKAALATLQGAALRYSGKVEEAKEKLQTGVLCYTTQQIKACPHPVTFSLPVAHYELGVCLWQLAGEEKATREQLRQISAEVETAYKWEHYELEERMIVKLASAKETIGKLLAR